MATSLTFKSADSGIEERSLEQIIGSSAALGGRACEGRSRGSDRLHGAGPGRDGHG
jgi:hypothetical protein